MRAFVFPGQGSQKVGMGAELAEASAAAREVFEEVDDALGQKLFAIMREGPEDELTLTENAQPAIMANAIAVLRVLEKEGGIALADKGDFVAGHSLGEYTALCAAGRVQPGRYRAAAEAARPGDAGGGAGGRRRHVRAARRRYRQGAGAGRCGGRGRSLHRRQRQRPRPGRAFRPQGRDRARHRPGQGASGSSAAWRCRSPRRSTAR